MNNNMPAGQEQLLQNRFPVTRRIWIVCVSSGLFLWAVGLISWRLGIIDEAVLFNFNAARLNADPLIMASQWISDYGRALILAIFLAYLLASYRISRLDAPKSIHLYTLTSYAVSGIATMILKLVFARPRPLANFGDQIEVLRDYLSYAMPSGHATNSVALILPFLLFVHGRSTVHVTVKILITLIAVGVSLSRVVLGVHYVGDVIAGVGNAILWLPVSMLLANWVIGRVGKY